APARTAPAPWSTLRLDIKLFIGAPDCHLSSLLFGLASARFDTPEVIFYSEGGQPVFRRQPVPVAAKLAGRNKTRVRDREMTGARIALALAAALLATSLPGAQAQDYPSRPVKVIVPFGAGGPADVTARQIGNILQESFGQPFVIENRTGAGGVIGGQVQMMIDAVPAMALNVAENQVRALATTGKTRSTVLPNAPTVIEAGVPGYEATIWLGLMAPAGTPKPIIDKLNAAVNA